MKGVLVAGGLALLLSVGAAGAQRASDLFQGKAVYLSTGYHFVELKLAGNTLVCAKSGRTDFSTLKAGEPVQFRGKFANYAGLYEQVMMMDDCDIKPLSVS